MMVIETFIGVASGELRGIVVTNAEGERNGRVGQGPKRVRRGSKQDWTLRPKQVRVETRRIE